MMPGFRRGAGAAGAGGDRGGFAGGFAISACQRCH